VTKACTHCKKAHVSCEAVRPCTRCVERGKQCSDGDAKKRGRKKRAGSASPLVPNFMKTESGLLPSLASTLMPNYGNSNNFTELPEFNNQQHLSDLPLDVFGEMFIFSPLEEYESQVRSLEPINNGPTIFRMQGEHFMKMKDYFGRRLPEIKFLFETFGQLREKLQKGRESLTEDVVVSIRRDFETYLNVFSSAFDQLGTPCIIWERCSVIRYVNQSFVDLTGFNKTIPTKLEDLAFNELLNTDGLRSYISGTLQVHMNFVPNSIIDNFHFLTGLRMGDSDRYVHGTLWVTVKRDCTNIPFLLVGLFLPNSTDTTKFRRL
jgi:PAS domain-containing protein